MINEHKVDEQWVRDFFQMVDRLDPAEYITHFAKDGQVVFGNQPPVMGKRAIEKALTEFYGQLKVMRHTVQRIWVEPGVTISQALVHYTRHDGQEFDLPATTIIDEPGEQVKKMQFFMDMSPLFS